MKTQTTKLNRGNRNLLNSNSEVSNFDGYVRSYIKSRVLKDTYKLEVIEGSENKSKRTKK